MSHERNMKYFNAKRVIYRREPITDIPTKVYDWGNYYENGTHECYELFRSKAKITTYKSLKWHMLVLWYLNPDLTQDNFKIVCKHLIHKPNGFVTFEVSEQLINTMIYEVSMCDLDKPPKNKLRKILFKEFSGLSLEQKLQIVGQMVGRSKSIHEDDIYQCMLDIHDLGKIITIETLSGLLNCSSRTIHRNMGMDLKKEKELLNKQI